MYKVFLKRIFADVPYNTCRVQIMLYYDTFNCMCCNEMVGCTRFFDSTCFSKGKVKDKVFK